MPRKCHIPNFFARRGISCDHLPNDLYEQAQQIIKRLESGAHFQSVNGKKTFFDKSKVCIPVGRKYRLYARLQGNQVTITHLTTHENYNNLLKRRPRGGLSN
jgi:hypothetical protein